MLSSRIAFFYIFTEAVDPPFIILFNTTKYEADLFIPGLWVYPFRL